MKSNSRALSVLLRGLIEATVCESDVAHCEPNILSEKYYKRVKWATTLIADKGYEQDK